MKIDYDPSVFVRRIKPCDDLAVIDGKVTPALIRAVTEILKYSVKEGDILGDGSDDAWFARYDEQVSHLRFISAGGLLKNCITSDVEPTADDITKEDLEELAEICFAWDRARKFYRRVKSRS